MEPRDHPGTTYSFSQVIFLFRIPQFVLGRTIQDSDGLEMIEETEISQLIGRNLGRNGTNARY